MFRDMIEGDAAHVKRLVRHPAHSGLRSQSARVDELRAMGSGAPRAYRVFPRKSLFMQLSDFSSATGSGSISEAIQQHLPSSWWHA